MQRALLALALLVQLHIATAGEAFKVSDIRIEGLQRISTGTVLNYLPIQVGDHVDAEKIAESIRALYRTGFFQDVTLEREGDVLIVDVVERPAIARIELHGNDEISSKKLLDALKGVGLAEGRVFNRSLLAAVERELQRQYFALGYYDVKIESTVSPLPRNRVSIRLDIREGETASVQQIQFVGNKRFSDSELRDQFELGPRPWWAFFSDSDKYSREKLAGDLERLRSFYQNRGFINFTITSTQVSITPDRRRIYITVNLSEGKQYHVHDIKLAGKLILPEQELRSLLKVKPGALYSQLAVTQSNDAIRKKYGEIGYAFANVNAVPNINEQAKTVDLTFFVDPAERVYVRHINISGNSRTKDEVIRREMQQLEGSWLSTEKVKQSRDRLNRLGFFDEVNIETPRVPGTNDQVDINVHVKERQTGSLRAGVGYGTSGGLLLNLGVQQDNFLGTGNQLSFIIDNDRINTVYQLSFLQRFYTLSGINRRIAIAYRDTNASNANLANYGFKSFTGSYGYQIPLSNENSVDLGVDFEDLTLHLSDNPTSIERAFVDRNGKHSMTYRASLGWLHDSRNRAVFPDEGWRQEVSAQVAIPGSDLQYYRLNADQHYYKGLIKGLTLVLDGTVSYGDGYGKTHTLPFFQNFYAGGMSTVRGFEINSLGPRDENNDPTGGTFRLLGSGGLRFPFPFVNPNAAQLTAFVDFGQVYDTAHGSVNLNDLRYSAGLSATWFSPLGPLTISLAQPLNARSGDRTQFFQFSIGSFF
ncbi:MAG TPA: outer membrane protein assembly factor BamA [Nitrococcus sp.]|nr:outer membrane protein assembly factor BamA [Nitrococcus sp.]